MTLLRAELPKRFPGIEFFFQPADIVTQILNFGLPAAIDVQFTGTDHARATRRSPPSWSSDPADPRRGRRACAPAPRRARRQPADGPHAPAADGPVGVQRRPERAGLAVGQLADGAGVLAQPAERRRLQHRGADAAVPASTRSTRCSTCRSPAPAAGRGGRRRRRSCSATSSRRRRRASSRSSRATTSCRRSTSTSACRAPTSRASRAQVQELVDEVRPKLPRGSQVDDARPGADDAGVVHRPRRRPRDGDRARLPADRRQLPVVDRRRRSSSPRCRRRSPASPGCCSSPARRCRCRR